MKKILLIICFISFLISCKSSERLTSPEHYIIKKTISEKVQLGSPAEFRIEVIPTDGYKMEEEAPIKLKFNREENSNVEIEKEIYTKSDLLNKDISKPVFIGRFIPKEKGNIKVKGELSFVVCTSSICEPKKTDIIFDFVAE